MQEQNIPDKKKLNLCRNVSINIPMSDNIFKWQCIFFFKKRIMDDIFWIRSKKKEKQQITVDALYNNEW